MCSHGAGATPKRTSAIWGSWIGYSPEPTRWSDKDAICCGAKCRDWHLTDKPPAPEFVAYWTNNGQKAVLGLDLTNRPRPSLSPIGLTTDKRLCWGWISRQRLTQSGHGLGVPSRDWSKSFRPPGAARSMYIILCRELCENEIQDLACRRHTSQVTTMAKAKKRVATRKKSSKRGKASARPARKKAAKRTKPKQAKSKVRAPRNPWPRNSGHRRSRQGRHQQNRQDKW